MQQAPAPPKSSAAEQLALLLRDLETELQSVHVELQQFERDSDSTLLQAKRVSDLSSAASDVPEADPARFSNTIFKTASARSKIKAASADFTLVEAVVSVADIERPPPKPRTPSLPAQQKKKLPSLPPMLASRRADSTSAKWVRGDSLSAKHSKPVGAK